MNQQSAAAADLRQNVTGARRRTRRRARAHSPFEYESREIEAYAARRLVRPGGYVFSFVPAFPIALSEFDRQIGHVRRYRIATMSAAMAAADLDVVDIRYVNAPGLVAWILGMRLLRMNPGQGPFMKVWDAGVIPIVRALEHRVRMPFGQSIMAVGRVV